MALPGYVVEYAVRWQGKKSSYIYQRFFRALYGYTQVVSKSNGKVYRYYRHGVLSGYPYIKAGKNIVIVPPNALQPLLRFLKTGQNPAHSFESAGRWQDLVRYSMSETFVDERDAAQAVADALSNTFVSTPGGKVSAADLLIRIDTLLPDELYSLYYAIRGIVSSEWYPAFAGSKDYVELSTKISDLLSRIK